MTRRPTRTRDHRTPDRRNAARTLVLVTADGGLRDELVRLSAAAGVVPQVCSAGEEGLGWWRRADLLLVGTDQVATLADLRPPRGAPVLVVSDRGTTEPDLRRALALGADGIMDLPEQTDELVALLGDLADDGRRQGPAVGVIGGSGGAGASTFAAALAQSAARHGCPLLMDLDPAGAGAGALLGLPSDPDVGWEALAARGGRLAGRALRETLPRAHGASVLTWRSLPGPLGSDTVREAFDAGVRGHDLVVVDLPRHGEVPADLKARLDLVLVLTRPDVTGLASAGRTVLRVGGECSAVVTRGPRPRSSLVDEVAGAPVLARMRDQPGLSDCVDLGFGPLRRDRGPLAGAVSRVLEVLDVRSAA